MYFEDAVTYFDKIVMFSHKEKQIDMLKELCHGSDWLDKQKGR